MRALVVGGERRADVAEIGIVAYAGVMWQNIISRIRQLEIRGSVLMSVCWV